MGIQGLIPFLKGAMVTTHVDTFSGEVVAVDASSWLHRGAYSCAKELADSIPTDRFLSFSKKRIEMLRSRKVEPLMVFDGRSLPSKAVTDTARKLKRTTNKALAEQAFLTGRKDVAYKLYQGCISITPEMAYRLMLLCRQMGVNFVVAPYEADSQMAFLAKSNRVAAIITEDSDLIAFGCSKIIYKLDSGGDCVMYDRELLKNDAKMGFAISGFDEKQLLHMCILSGCDYLPSVPGMGLKTAFKYIKQYGNAHNAIRRLRGSSKLVIPSDYAKEFLRAEQTFLHQRVFHPDLRTLVPLSDFTDDIEDDNRDYYIGPVLADEIAQKLADGHLNPKTLEPFVPDRMEVFDNEGDSNKENSIEFKNDSSHKTRSSFVARAQGRKYLKQSNNKPLPPDQPSLFDMQQFKKARRPGQSLETSIRLERATSIGTPRSHMPSIVTNIITPPTTVSPPLTHGSSGMVEQFAYRSKLGRTENQSFPINPEKCRLSQPLKTSIKTQTAVLDDNKRPALAIFSKHFEEPKLPVVEPTSLSEESSCSTGMPDRPPVLRNDTVDEEEPYPTVHDDREAGILSSVYSRRFVAPAFVNDKLLPRLKAGNASVENNEENKDSQPSKVVERNTATIHRQVDSNRQIHLHSHIRTYNPMLKHDRGHGLGRNEPMTAKSVPSRSTGTMRNAGFCDEKKTTTPNPFDDPFGFVAKFGHSGASNSKPARASGLRRPKRRSTSVTAARTLTLDNYGYKRRDRIKGAL
eukprot:CFRG3334T1